MRFGRAFADGEISVYAGIGIGHISWGALNLTYPSIFRNSAFRLAVCGKHTFGSVAVLKDGSPKRCPDVPL